MVGTGLAGMVRSGWSSRVMARLDRQPEDGCRAERWGWLGGARWRAESWGKAGMAATGADGCGVVRTGWQGC